MKNLAYKSRDTMETDGAISSDIIGKDKGGQMNNDVCIIVCKRAISMVVHMIAFLAEKYAKKCVRRMIRKCCESTREPENHC